LILFGILKLRRIITFFRWWRKLEFRVLLLGRIFFLFVLVHFITLAEYRRWPSQISPQSFWRFSCLARRQRPPAQRRLPRPARTAEQNFPKTDFRVSLNSLRATRAGSSEGSPDRASFAGWGCHTSMLMDFDQLNTFLEVAKLGNFSRAAEKVLRSQPAVSAQ